MEGFNKMFHLTPEKQRQLALLKNAALHSEKGTAHFFELDSCPVFSMFLITGDMKDDGSNERDLEMKFVNQGDHYPTILVKKDDVSNFAYGDYIRKKLTEYASDQSIPIEILSLSRYIEEYESVLHVLQACIRDNHGVRCFENGDMTQDVYGNVYFLHICDVINIYVNKKKGLRTKLVLKSQLLDEIKDEMKDVLFSKLLKGKKLEIFDYQVDVFYMIMCYYCNHSFIPIRTYIDSKSDVFLKSRFFMNDNHFVRHQNGKMSTINFVNPGKMSTVLYRSA
jgi:hypothetical protein